MPEHDSPWGATANRQIAQLATNETPRRSSMRIGGKLWESVKIKMLRFLGRLRSRVIGPYAIGVLSRSENGLLLAPAGDMMVGRRLSFNGRYDPELLRLILDKCEPASHVLFVGAHVGALAIPTARVVKQVTAIEANPNTFEFLQMNVALASALNVHLYNFAAGDRNGDAHFLANILNSGGSGLEMGAWDQWAYAYDKPARITVPIKRLDDVFPEERFDLIVMDIEGAEALALSGMRQILTRSRGLLVEVFESHLRDVAKISNDEFLSFVSPFYDEAQILPEKPRKDNSLSTVRYTKSAFPDMMADCCRQRMANVLFSKVSMADNTDAVEICSSGDRR
jgi:FkbM family methyltransferase